VVPGTPAADLPDLPAVGSEEFWAWPDGSTCPGGETRLEWLERLHLEIPVRSLLDGMRAGCDLWEAVRESEVLTERWKYRVPFESIATVPRTPDCLRLARAWERWFDLLTEVAGRSPEGGR